MPSWLDIVATMWPIAATITPLMMMGGFFWLRTQFAPRGDLDEHAAKLGDIREELVRIDERLTNLQSDMDASPSRSEMSERISYLAERIGRMEAATEGILRQFATTNQYLHTIIERGLRL